MKLQEQIDQTDLDMTEAQVKAFFLGVLCAEKPLSFQKAMDELFAEIADSRKDLEAPLKEVWDQVSKNTKSELEKMFPEEEDIHTFIELSKDQLDYFLTAMSLSGTNTESCNDEELAELIDELEDTVEDMDEFLSDSNATAEDGEDFKEFLLETWSEFTATK
jgi:uncharacterized protein YgfB (UPF0149 family)